MTPSYQRGQRHTPGPWSVPHFATDHHCECQYVLSDSQDGPGAIATVHHQRERGGEHNEPFDVAVANAHLIAAAPELLEALQQAREALHQHYVDWDGEPEDAVALQQALAKCDAALAKAGLSAGEGAPHPARPDDYGPF